MKKYEKLKKRAIIEGGIGLVVVMAVMGGMFFLSHLEETLRDDLRKLQKLVGADQARIDEYRAQIDRAGVSSQIYEEISHNKRDMNFLINRSALRYELETLKDKYRLSHLSMEVSPFDAYTNKELTALDVAAVRSVVEIRLGAMSDTHIFSFIQELNYRLPGLIKPESLHMVREKNMNVEALKQMKMGVVPQMVSGILKFTWYGFVPKEEKPENG